MLRVCTTLIALLCAAWTYPNAAQAETIRLLSSWPASDKPSYAQPLEFKKHVETLSGGKIKVEISGPEAVPPLEQLQPVSAGVFDMLFTHGAYHFGSKGLALLIDTMKVDPQKRRDSGIFDFVDNFYQQNHQLRLIALTNQSSHGYQTVLIKPVDPDGNWSGLKIRGVAVFHGVIKAMGAAPAGMPISESYSALERGVIDGTVLPAAGILAYKFHEVAKYRIAPTFGSNSTIFVMNQKKWNSLSKENQQIILEAGKKAEIGNIPVGDKLIQEEWAELEKNGVKTITLSQRNTEIVTKAWQDHLWLLGEKCCGEAALKLRELGRKADLLK